MIATPSPDRQPRRVQMSRQHPWRAEHPDALIVSRPSRWGNPFRVERVRFTQVPYWTCRSATYTANPVESLTEARQLAVDLYRQAFTPDADGIRAELRGHDLACWCHLDQPCHADVLLEIANMWLLHERAMETCARLDAIDPNWRTHHAGGTA